MLLIFKQRIMNLSEIKNLVPALKELNFKLEDGSIVPQHFHITEVGVVDKHFIDCGGTERREKVANFQLWSAEDHDHRLAPQKLLSIIELSERVLNMEDLKIEVEYQSSTIGKYGLVYNGESFVLTNQHTDCLAKDNCGIPEEKQKISLATVGSEANCCSPSSGCC